MPPSSATFPTDQAADLVGDQPVKKDLGGRLRPAGEAVPGPAALV